jgi:Holliday junction resolvase RusA-like endonuclease
MKSYIFNVPGKPVGKQRPRFSRKTGRAYTPKETATYENLIRLAFAEEYDFKEPTGQPVRLSVVAIFPIPKSWAKKKQIAAEELRIFPGKPDADNILKAVQDAGNGVIWKDDALIETACISKRYGSIPGLTVMVEVHE